MRAPASPPGVGAVIASFVWCAVERREESVPFGAVVMFEQVLERRLAVEEGENASSHLARIPSETRGISNEPGDHPPDLFVLTTIKHERKARPRTERLVARQELDLFVLEVQEQKLAVRLEQRQSELELSCEQALRVQQKKLIELAVHAEKTLGNGRHEKLLARFPPE
jgi:hypothetical protein